MRDAHLCPPGHLQESEEQAMQVLSPDVQEWTFIRRRWWERSSLLSRTQRSSRQQRAFSTMTLELLALDDWLRQRHIEVIALERMGISTPPTMYTSVGGVVRGPRRQGRTYAEDHPYLLLINLNSFDQGTNDLAARVPSRLLESSLHFARKGAVVQQES